MWAGDKYALRGGGKRNDDRRSHTWRTLDSERATVRLLECALVTWEGSDLRRIDWLARKGWWSFGILGAL